MLTQSNAQAQVFELAFDPVSERMILALVASDAELRNAGPSLERIQKNGLGWEDIGSDTRARYDDVLRSARGFLDEERDFAMVAATAGADATSSAIRDFQVAQKEFLQGSLG
eukprot:scaffold73_cov252-Pinguiococcus_pyrenoidosus.AAC.30